MEKQAKKTLADLHDRHHGPQHIRQPVGSLSGGRRQSVAVAKAVMLDAPSSSSWTSSTAALGVSQTRRGYVLDIIEQLASRGIAPCS